jgi:hypothetical protein
VSAPPSHKPDRVYSRHASAPSAVGYQADESRSAHVVSHHLDGLLRKQASSMLQPVTTMGFAAFQARLSVSPDPKAHRAGNHRPFPQRGSYPPKNPPRQQPCRITAVFTLLMLGRSSTAPKSERPRTGVPRDDETRKWRRGAQEWPKPRPPGAKHPTCEPLFVNPPTEPKPGVHVRRSAHGSQATARLPLCTRHGAS